MDTIVISDLSQLSLAANVLQAGGLVASPTETVYGLCANALDPLAVKKIFEAKGRPNDNPLIIHISSLEMLPPLVKNISSQAKLLIDAFWPGPLTLIFEASDLVPIEVRGGLTTVAIRFPSHPIMQELISSSGLPLAAPSANTSGKPSPTNAKRVIEDLTGKIEVIIDGGDCSVGLESTVLDTTGSIPTILRPGLVTLEMLEEVVSQVAIDPALLAKPNASLKPKAPGMKYTHYSPNADVWIVKCEDAYLPTTLNTLVEKGHLEGNKIGLLVCDELLTKVQGDCVLSMGSLADLSTIGSHLFEALRAFDDAGMDKVYAMSFPSTGVGHAIMNRLEKAAGYHFIE